jgi:hypothetical protein
MKRKTVALAGLLFLSLIELGPAGLSAKAADTSFAKYDTNGSCDFWVARRNDVPLPDFDKWSAGSYWACAGGTHSMSAQVADLFTGLECHDTGNTHAECTLNEINSNVPAHNHDDNTNGNSLANTTSWQSSD